MSEKQPVHHETHHQPEHEPQHEREEVSKAERGHETKAETSSEAGSLESIQEKVRKASEESKDIKVEQEDESAAAPSVSRTELKEDALKRTLNRTRKELNATERVLSKVMHQPVVDRVSNVGSKTLARPIPLLVAGFVSLFGSAVALYAAKHNGFRYNLGVYIFLFAFGYVLGVVIEALLATFKKPKD